MNGREILEHIPKSATPEQLAAHLDEACGGDAELQRRLFIILGAEGDGATVMFDRASARRGARMSEVGGAFGGRSLEPSSAAKSGSSRSGKAGLGVVWRAEQREPVT